MDYDLDRIERTLKHGNDRQVIGITRLLTRLVSSGELNDTSLLENAARRIGVVAFNSFHEPSSKLKRTSIQANLALLEKATFHNQEQLWLSEPYRRLMAYAGDMPRISHLDIELAQKIEGKGIESGLAKKVASAVAVHSLSKNNSRPQLQSADKHSLAN